MYSASKLNFANIGYIIDFQESKVAISQNFHIEYIITESILV